MQFADDTTVYNTENQIQQALLHINKDLDMAKNWFKAKKLSINLSKTKYSVYDIRK